MISQGLTTAGEKSFSTSLKGQLPPPPPLERFGDIFVLPEHSNCISMLRREHKTATQWRRS